MSNRVLNVGSKFPKFNKQAVVSLEVGKEFEEISNRIHIKDSKWMVMFFWPKDFTFVCPTEIEEFNNNFEKFKEKNTMLIGASTDSEFVHLAWRQNSKALKDLKFPMIADTSKSLSERLGILEKSEKICYRATFIVDPEGIIRWVSVNDLSVGRNVNEVIRVLDGLQDGGLVPCNWEKGQATL